MVRPGRKEATSGISMASRQDLHRESEGRVLGIAWTCRVRLLYQRGRDSTLLPQPRAPRAYESNARVSAHIPSPLIHLTAAVRDSEAANRHLHPSPRFVVRIRDEIMDISIRIPKPRAHPVPPSLHPRDFPRLLVRDSGDRHIIPSKSCLRRLWVGRFPRGCDSRGGRHLMTSGPCPVLAKE